ncbi:MAG TPA: hypothetical protein VK211_24985 [Kamptonema sp.]|nr:hypothetical protein [Kamptonema sp.]
MNKSNDKFIDGFTWVLCGNFLLWFVLLFVMGNAMNKISWFGNWINRCIDISSLPSPGSFGLARGLWLFSLLTGSISFAQFCYIIPLIIWAKKRGKWEFIKGVFVASVTTILLVANCFVSVVFC